MLSEIRLKMVITGACASFCVKQRAEMKHKSKMRFICMLDINQFEAYNPYNGNNGLKSGLKW